MATVASWHYVKPRRLVVHYGKLIKIHLDIYSFVIR